MAYREFYQRQDILRDDNSPIERGLANFFSGIAAAQEKKKRAENEYQYTLDYGFFPNDNAFNEEFVKSTIQSGKSDIRKYGNVSDRTLNQMESGKRIRADQKAQEERFKLVNSQIDKRGTEDVWYDPKYDKQTWEAANFGNGDIDFRTRGAEQEKALNIIGNDPRSFKLNDYAAHYVKNRGTKKGTVKNENELSGATTGTSYSSPFVDPKTGAIGPTDKDAVEFLNSQDGALASVQFKVDMDLLNPDGGDVSAIKQLADSGDERASWARGLSKDEILTNIKTDASKNPFNKTPYADRVTQKAKKLLTDASDIATESVVGFKQPKSGGFGVTNEALRHNPTFYNNKIKEIPFVGPEDASNKLSQLPKNVSGPGGVLVQKNGKPITIEANSQKAFNYRDAKNTERTGRGAFNITGYQLGMYDQNGNLKPIEANSFDELKGKINGLSPDELKKMAPSLQIGLNGFAVDKATLAGDVLNQSFDLNEQLGEAKSNGDVEKQAAIEAQIAQLNQTRSLMDIDGVSDEDIVNAASKAGLKQIRRDQILKADKSDIDYIKSVSGLDLGKESNWSPEMKEVNDLYKKKWAEANATSPVKNLKPKAKQSMVRVKSPDGKTGTIPLEDLDAAMAEGYKKLD